MRQLSAIPNRRNLSVATRSWTAFLLPLAIAVAAVAEADLSETGRWQGKYLLGLAPGHPNYASFPRAIGTHVAVLRGPRQPGTDAETTRVLLYGTEPVTRVWSFVADTQLTVPVAHYLSGANLHGVTRPAHDLFCGGHAQVNGRLIAIGGQYRHEIGTETAYEFNPLYSSPAGPNPTTPPWRTLASMARGRWYATATMLGSGKLLSTSGTKHELIYAFGGDTGTLQDDVRPISTGGLMDWSQPLLSGDPDARMDHSAIMDRKAPYLYGQRMVVFGGQTGATSRTNDVWAHYLNADGLDQLWLGGDVSPREHFAMRTVWCR